MKLYQHTTWTDEAEAGLCDSLHDDKAIIKDQIENGISQLWYIQNVDSWMVTRTETQGDKKVLAICCYQGQELHTIGKEIIKAATEQGFDGLRYHTRRKGLNRLLHDFDFEHQESVYYKHLQEA